jgi:hypothetical protein
MNLTSASVINKLGRVWQKVGLIRSNITALGGKDRRKCGKKVRVVGIPAEVRSMHLLKTI